MSFAGRRALTFLAIGSPPGRHDRHSNDAGRDHRPAWVERSRSSPTGPTRTPCGQPPKRPQKKPPPRSGDVQLRALSEWSEINRDAFRQPVRISEEMFDLIAACVDYSRASDSAFDITVGP